MRKRNSRHKRVAIRDRMPSSAESEPQPLYTPLQEAIEAQRAQLSRADSILCCLLMALRQADEGGEQELPQFADVIELVRRLLRDSIDGLDSVRIGPLLGNIRHR